jgi:hypothetical protein
MDEKTTTLERAFQIARSGRAPTVGRIKRALADEGYDQRQIEGQSLTKQLKALINAAKSRWREPAALNR